jgi:hypothetical protein
MSRLNIRSFLQYIQQGMLQECILCILPRQLQQQSWLK